jgi:hypothetical protein
MARIDVSRIDSEDNLSMAIRDALVKPIDRMEDTIGRELSLKQVLNRPGENPVVYCMCGATTTSLHGGVIYKM